MLRGRRSDVHLVFPLFSLLFFFSFSLLFSHKIVLYFLSFDEFLYVDIHQTDRGNLDTSIE